MKNNAKSYRKIVAVSGIGQCVVARGCNGASAEMTSPRPVANLNIIRNRTHKASFRGSATGTALTLAFAVSVATLEFGFSANANERKPAFTTFELYGEQVGHRSVAAAKAEAGRAALTSTAAGQIPRARASGTFITFDAPGAIGGTEPTSINNFGFITGSYFDNVGSGSHGFVRTREGTFVSFDVPGAVNGTFPSGINNFGFITGSYGDNLGSGFHGFVRTPYGTFVLFDVPVAAATVSVAINDEGAVTGWYFDVNFFQHTFLRAYNGALTTFDPPAAVYGSTPSTITDLGVILGVYFDADSRTHGFLRSPAGAFSEILGPGGATGQFDPFNLGAALSINFQGMIAGTYFAPIVGNPFGGNYTVFIRSKDGTYITFAAADYPPCCIWSAPSDINLAGTVTGSFNDGFTINHGFVRFRDGTLTTFDAPKAGTGFNQGTLPLAITSEGVIMGLYRDPNNLSHGFLFSPRRDK